MAPHLDSALGKRRLLPEFVEQDLWQNNTMAHEVNDATMHRGANTVAIRAGQQCWSIRPAHDDGAAAVP